MTREIIELIDREADLIMRGVSNTNLEGLRQRIATLFLEYCKNPMFNPEIARHLKVIERIGCLIWYVFKIKIKYQLCSQFLL